MASKHFELFVSLNQQAKKGVTMLDGPYNHMEIALPFYNEGKKDYVWNTDDPLE